LAQGDIKVSLLSEVAYQQVKNSLGVIGTSALVDELNRIAAILVEDINSDQKLDYDDVLAWNHQFNSAGYRGDLSALSSLANAIVRGSDSAEVSSLAAQVVASVESATGASSVSGSWTPAGGMDPNDARNPHYSFTLSSQAAVSISLISSLDTYLFLYTGDGSYVDENDDGGEGSNSQLDATLAAGEYLIVAATFTAGFTGSFELTVDGLASSLSLIPRDDDTSEGNTDVSDSWSISETVNANACGEGTYTDSYALTITQSGSQLSVQSSIGTHTGTVSGNQLNWSGSYFEDGGTTSTSISATFSGNSLSGSSSWTWSGGGEFCSGTSSFTGTRTSGGG
jgi:hypothetical protein